MKPPAWPRTLLWLQWLLFLAAAPLFLFPSPRRAAALLIVPLVFLLNRLIWRRWLPLTPFNPALLLLALTTFVSLWATTDLAASLPKVAGLLYGWTAFFLIVESAQTRAGWAGGLCFYLLAGLGLALAAVPGANWDSKLFLIDWFTARLPSGLAGLPGARDGFHPIEVAGALLWVLPLTLAAAGAIVRRRFPFQALRGRWLWSILLTLAALFEGGVLVLTQSRGAYVSLAVTALLAGCIALQARLGWAGLAKAAAVLTAAGAMAAAAFWERLTQAVHALPGWLSADIYSLATIETRMLVWARAVEGLKDFAFTGMGLNRFREVVFLLYPILGLNSDADRLGHAHNELLQAGLDLGLAGLAGFLALYFIAAAMLFQLYRRGAGLRWMALGLFASLFSHFLFGLVDAVALGAKPGLLFWLLLGLTAGLYQRVFGRAAGEREP